MLKLTPPEKESLLILAYVYAINNKPEKAKALLELLWHYYPDDDDIARLLGFTCLELSDYEMARAMFEVCVDLEKKQGREPNTALALLMKRTRYKLARAGQAPAGRNVVPLLKSPNRGSGDAQQDEL